MTPSPQMMEQATPSAVDQIVAVTVPVREATPEKEETPNAGWTSLEPIGSTTAKEAE